MVPLLFTHTNYKSYPESFVDKGQWANMNLWLQTLSSQPVRNVRMDDVRDADDWLGRLAEAGHHLFASSGTSGKCSFLNQTSKDLDLADRAYQLSFDAQNQTFRAANDRPVFVFFPEHGVHRLCSPNAHFWSRVAAPGQLHFFHRTSPCAQRPVSVPDSYAGRLRQALRCPTKSPHSRPTPNSSRLMSAAMGRDMIDRIYALRHERLVFGVMWPAASSSSRHCASVASRGRRIHPDTVLLPRRRRQRGETTG